MPPGGARGAVTVFGGNHFTAAESRRRALVRAEEIGARSKVFRGAGRAFGLSPGYRFELAEHPRASLNAAFNPPPLSDSTRTERPVSHSATSGSRVTSAISAICGSA